MNKKMDIMVTLKPNDIVEAKKVYRPLADPLNIGKVTGVPHAALLVTTRDGNKYLVSNFHDRGVVAELVTDSDLKGYKSSKLDVWKSSDMGRQIFATSSNNSSNILDFGLRYLFRDIGLRYLFRDIGERYLSRDIGVRYLSRVIDKMRGNLLFIQSHRQKEDNFKVLSNSEGKTQSPNPIAEGVSLERLVSFLQKTIDSPRFQYIAGPTCLGTTNSSAEYLRVANQLELKEAHGFGVAERLGHFDLDPIKKEIFFGNKMAFEAYHDGLTGNSNGNKREQLSSAAGQATSVRPPSKQKQQHQQQQPQQGREF